MSGDSTAGLNPLGLHYNAFDPHAPAPGIANDIPDPQKKISRRKLRKLG